MEIMSSNFMPAPVMKSPCFRRERSPSAAAIAWLRAPSKNDGIQIIGQIVDNDTNRGIKDAFFVVLNPGVTFKKFEAKNYSDSLIFTSAQADSKGNFSLPDLLQRGVSYNILVAAEGYTAQVFEDVGFGDSDASEQEYTIPLTQR